MRTIFLSVYIPAINSELEFKVPKRMLIKDFIKLSIDAIKDDYGVVKKYNTDNLRLLSKEDKSILDSNKTIKQLGLSSDDKLLLI